MTLTVAMNEDTFEIPFRIQNDLTSFREWAGDNDLPEKARLCFYHGEVFVGMGKEQIFTHVAMKTELTRVLAGIVKTDKRGTYLADGVLFTNEAAELSVNPDAVFVSNEAISSGRVILVEGKQGGFVELLGTPDMVLEVVSDSSEKKDNQTLFEGYFEAGVSEYWLVDARGSEVEFTLYRHAGKKYLPTRAQAGGWQKSAVFGKSFRIARGTNPAGNPDFTLEVK